MKSKPSAVAYKARYYRWPLTPSCHSPFPPLVLALATLGSCLRLTPHVSRSASVFSQCLPAACSVGLSPKV